MFSLQIILLLIVNLLLRITKSFVRIRLILVEITRHVANCLTIWATVVVLDQMPCAVLTVKIIYHYGLKWIAYFGKVLIGLILYDLPLFHISGLHCCPENTTCDVEHRVCKPLPTKTDYNNLMQFLLARLNNILN